MSAVNTAAAAPQGLARPRAILFDWDNTLIDSWMTIHEALNAVMAASDKPDPAPVALALEPSGVEPGDAVWFVGDTGVDMECAYNSGCIPVLLGHQATAEEFLRCTPRLAFPDAASLFHFVQDL